MDNRGGEFVIIDLYINNIVIQPPYTMCQLLFIIRLI